MANIEQSSIVPILTGSQKNLQLANIEAEQGTDNQYSSGTCFTWDFEAYSAWIRDREPNKVIIKTYSLGENSGGKEILQVFVLRTNEKKDGRIMRLARATLSRVVQTLRKDRA